MWNCNASSWTPEPSKCLFPLGLSLSFLQAWNIVSPQSTNDTRELNLASSASSQKRRETDEDYFNWSFCYIIQWLKVKVHFFTFSIGIVGGSTLCTLWLQIWKQIAFSSVLVCCGSTVQYKYLFSIGCLAFVSKYLHDFLNNWVAI